MRLLRVFEMVRLIRVEREAQRFDWNEVLALLAETRRRGEFVYPACSLIDDLAPGTVDGSVLNAGSFGVDVVSAPRGAAPRAGRRAHSTNVAFFASSCGRAALRRSCNGYFEFSGLRRLLARVASSPAGGRAFVDCAPGC